MRAMTEKSFPDVIAGTGQSHKSTGERRLHATRRIDRFLIP